METKEKKILGLSILGVLVMITLISGITYAWFSSNIDGSDTTINVTTATLGPLKYTGTEITAENILPGWISSDATLTVEGTVTGESEIEYYCYMENTGEVSDVEYRISGDGEENSTSGTWTSISTDPIVTGSIAEINASDTYKIGIRFKETGLDQNSQQNKTLSVKVYCEIDESVTLARQIMSDNPNVSTREAGTFNTIFTTSNNGNTIYRAKGQDELNTYYFAGNVTNNYVKFGTNANGQDLWWRIVRINEDGSVRLIYAGLSAADKSAFINTSQIYNSNSNYTYLVGYEYSEGEQHDLGTNSSIKGVVDSWYTNNLMDENYYISKTAIYCNDRTLVDGAEWVETTTSELHFSGYERLFTNTTKTPIFTCKNNADKFTVSNTSGNGALEYGIGLITADEVAFAGGLYNTNNANYYIATNASTGATWWWTITPSRWDGNVSAMFRVGGLTNNGFLSSWDLGIAFGVRPVTSLKSCVTWKSGNGTSDNPYTVSISDECALLEN